MRVLKESGKFKDATCDETCAKVSIVGAGMQSHSGVASKMFEALDVYKRQRQMLYFTGGSVLY